MLDLLKIRKKTGRHKTLATGGETAATRAVAAPEMPPRADKKPDPATQRKPAAPPREAKSDTRVNRETGESRPVPVKPAPTASTPAKSPRPPDNPPEIPAVEPRRASSAAPVDPKPASVLAEPAPAAYEPPPTRRKPSAAAADPAAPAEPAPGESVLAEAKTANDASLRHLLCKVHQETFAVPINDILEILRERTLTPLPLTARALAGILSLRGRMVPVVDAALRLGFAPFPSDENCRIVVFEIGEEWIGLRVAAVGQVTVIDPEAVQHSAAALGESRSDLTSGVLRIGSQFVTVPVLLQLLDVNP